MKCPKCGHIIVPPHKKWMKEAQTLYDELTLRFRDDPFTSAQAQALAGEKGLSKGNYDAYRIWEVLRTQDWLIGVDPELRYRKWRIGKTSSE